MTVRAAGLRSLAAYEAHEISGHDIASASAPRHWEACTRADRVIVAGFKSHLLQADVSNQLIAEYVRAHPDKLIGFAGLDPSDPDRALADLNEATTEHSFKGGAIAPAAQGFHPASSSAYRVYEKLAEQALPLLVHHGLYFCVQHRLEYARPVLFDEVARDFPDLRIILAHTGGPWTDEAIALIGKHPHVYAEISGLLLQPWRAYTTLLTAFQAGVMDKLLFASGFPLSTTERALESLYRVNRICQGTSLPVIPRDRLRALVERPTLDLLGLPDVAPRRSENQVPAMIVADPDI
jgi:predicted TIM-barrel fold metal-dependent hydrolase